MDPKIDLPIAISCVAGQYLIFSIEVFAYLRREHRVCGMLIGSLPQSPSQNVFLGLPVQLMPEEVFLLVSKGVAYVTDDSRTHQSAANFFDAKSKATYLAKLETASRRAFEARTAAQKKRREVALQKHKQLGRDSSLDSASDSQQNEGGGEGDDVSGEPILDSVESCIARDSLQTNSFSVTPATSTELIRLEPALPPSHGDLPSSYALYEYLHEKGYFISPGLRFGCQYTVYPDDPLRFHSHFLANGVDWDQEIDLMDMVGGGRLGTGVKKGYLFGGRDPKDSKIRAFSVEWAAM